MDKTFDFENTQLSKRSRRQGKSGTKSVKPLQNEVNKKGKFSLQYDVVKATVEKKKVKEKDVFDKNQFTRSQTRTKKKK
jgi:hypothetical protein